MKKIISTEIWAAAAQLLGLPEYKLKEAVTIYESREPTSDLIQLCELRRFLAISYQTMKRRLKEYDLEKDVVITPGFKVKQSISCRTWEDATGISLTGLFCK